MSTRAVEINRYRALLVVLGGVLAVLAAIDLGLRATLGLMPAPLLRASFRDPSLHDRVARRVSGVIADRRPGDPPLAVVIGASSARDAFMPAVLAGADPEHHRWLNLSVPVASYDEMRYMFRPLFVSGMEADLVVIAVHLGWLAGRIVGDPALRAASTAGRSWLRWNQGRLNHMARLALADVRERLLLGLGVRFDALYPPATDPWRGPTPEPFRMLDLQRPGAQMGYWRSKRWFEPASFIGADAEVADAAAVIAGSQRVGRRVVIVLMPEATALRAAIPPEAEAAFRRAVARVPHPPPVLDLRAALVDPMFRDQIHLNDLGDVQLSRMLPPLLAAAR